MKFVNKEVKHVYSYNGNLYKTSKRKAFAIGDLFYDGRDDFFKVIEDEKDLLKVGCMAPELYVILERVK